jgi:hypothetical protein
MTRGVHARGASEQQYGCEEAAEQDEHHGSGASDLVIMKRSVCVSITRFERAEVTMQLHYVCR